jgi:hypothetical protein
VDLNGDGHIDVLSGSYSRSGGDMAGLFQVLWGSQGGGFSKAKALDGSDGKPLILPGKGDDADVERICTRPFAVDLDGDGKLDIVAGNFRGTFGFFKGLGKAKFAPDATWLQVGSQDMAVDHHGDPCCVDWDGDGDVDIVSGSSRGGAYLFTNTGSKKKPKFAKRVTLVAPSQGQNGSNGDVEFGDAHCTAPASDWRVWVDDLTGDGKLDLLVGDTVTMMHLAEGVQPEAARAKLASWNNKRDKFFATPRGSDKAAQKKWQDDYAALIKERDTFAVEERTGFVWLFARK